MKLALTGGKTLGHPEEPTGHELRQAVTLVEVLLREGNHAEGCRGAVRLQVRLRPGGTFHAHIQRRHGGFAEDPTQPEAGTPSTTPRSQRAWTVPHGRGMRRAAQAVSRTF